jgi:predicted  nucleic acid-binding Zn-ribbon protein
MNVDLERVIALQRVDTAAQEAERRLADEPERTKAFEARLERAREQVASAKQRLAANQEARRALEKDAAVHQGRLSKFRDQAMEVKTNQEYHAIQKEMSYAQGEIKALEEKILERMLDADDLTAALKRGEAELAKEQKDVEAERRAMAAELSDLRAARERLGAERATIVAAMDKRTLAIFEQVASRRHGVAVAEARDGVCTICHVRLRPQVFNNIRRNAEIIQCDSCQRILYFVPPAAAEQPAPVD